jgi:hypothetical protein
MCFTPRGAFRNGKGNSNMESISARDRELLRRRAQIQLDYANSPQNEIILKKWRAQAEGRRESPPVRFLGSNFPNEVITPRLQCEGIVLRPPTVSRITPPRKTSWPCTKRQSNMERTEVRTK